MQLTLNDVARLCNVTKGTAYKWVLEESLPAKRAGGLFRVNPAELLEWASVRKLYVSPEIFRAMNGDSVGKTGLTEALQAGGVVHGITGDSRQEILRRIIDGLPLPIGCDSHLLLELLLARESLGGTAIGDGIAVPHPRRPVVLLGARPVVRLCFLTKPIDFGATDGKGVDTLFLMISSTVREHLQLLARLASVLRHGDFRALLRKRPSMEQIVEELRRIEESFMP
jgi:PTS system nitrogen regulatory IIA component